MKRQVIIIALALLLPCTLLAETKEQRAEARHELRIGCGDPIITKAWSGDWFFPQSNGGGNIWRETYGKTTPEAHDIMTDGQYFEKKGKTHVLGHFFVEYQYRLNSFLGLGLNTDVYNYWNDYNVYNGYREKVGEYTDGYLYMDFVPRVRFTFLHKQYVNLYASAGVGFAMFTNYNGKYFECAPKFETTLFGVSIGENRFFGTVEFLNIGFTIPSLRVLPIQIFTASVGYRF